MIWLIGSRLRPRSAPARARRARGNRGAENQCPSRACRAPFDNQLPKDKRLPCGPPLVGSDRCDDGQRPTKQAAPAVGPEQPGIRFCYATTLVGRIADRLASRPGHELDVRCRINRIGNRRDVSITPGVQHDAAAVVAARPPGPADAIGVDAREVSSGRAPPDARMPLANTTLLSILGPQFKPWVPVLPAGNPQKFVGVPPDTVEASICRIGWIGL